MAAPAAGPAPAMTPPGPVRPAVFHAAHTLVATVAAGTAEAAAAAVRALPPGIDCAEVRLDALWAGPPGPDEATAALQALLEAGAARGVPLLATLRPARQGGAYAGPEEVRLGLLAAAAQAGFSAVDVEMGLATPGPVLKAIRTTGAKIVLSDHLPGQAPSRNDGVHRLLAMHDLHGDLHKLAFRSDAFPDILRALELVHAHAGTGRAAVAPIGQGGAMVRALLPLAGNAASYGHAPGLRPAVTGQPAVTAVQATWRHWGLAPLDAAARLGAPAPPTGHGDGPAPREDPAEGHPPWLAVLGNPVGRSLSPRIHNTALQAAGRRERFGALTVPDSPGAFRLVATVAPRIGLAGASVTAPHKRRAADVARGDAAVQATGAANCLRFTRAGAEATNTDAAAFGGVLAAHRPDRVGVLGAGGAARAALWAARERGAEAVFTSRDADRARRVTDDLGVPWVPWRKRAGIRVDAWVQATPLGHADGPPPEAPLLEAPQLEAANLLVELVYGDGPTTLEAQARAAGLDVVDGRAFLVAQAVDAYRFWTGGEPDRAAMEAAVRGDA